MSYSALPIAEIPRTACERLLGIFFDIDDTLSYNGKIYPGAYQSLWDAKESGLIVAAITGRPAGWADHIARMWPVDGVIGENGAFYFCFDEESGKLIKRFEVPDPETRRFNRRRLNDLYEMVKNEFPGISLSSDQSYRENDLAIDFCEDVSVNFSLDDARRIKRLCEDHGAEAKISSIHVNAWFGTYNKLKMCKIFLRERFSLDVEALTDRFLFLGDSPNDVPMFRFFPLSIGVATVEKYNDPSLMAAFPTYVTSGEGSYGFAQSIAEVISKRPSHK